MIDFGDLPVFDATTYPCIVIARKQEPDQEHNIAVLNVTQIDTLQNLAQEIRTGSQKLSRHQLSSKGWTLKSGANHLREKLQSTGKPFEKIEGISVYAGIKTGLNEAFVITESVRQELLARDAKSLEIIKPWIRGRDVKQWGIAWDDLYVLAVQNSSDSTASNVWANASNERDALEVFSATYPAIWAHLNQYESKLRSRSDQGKWWWELRACAFYSEFSKDKIVWAKYGIEPTFAYDTSGYLCVNTVFIAPTKQIALLGILNSKAIRWLALNTFNVVSGGYIEWIPANVSQLPIPDLTPNLNSRIAYLVQQSFNAPDDAARAPLEAELNALVYQAYGLDEYDIRVIEEHLGTR